MEFIEDSPHGIVLFSFGSTVAISKLPENIQRTFIEALARIPQKVLLKYEGTMENKPKNVMTRTWLPQRDILRKGYRLIVFMRSNYLMNNFCIEKHLSLHLEVYSKNKYSRRNTNSNLACT